VLRALPVPDRDRQCVLRALASGARAGGSTSQTLAQVCGHIGPAAAYWTDRLSDYMQAGMPLSTALGALPQLFPSPLPQVIAAAGRTGTLQVVLDRLEAALARRSRGQALLAKAMAYPMTTLILALPLVVVASTVVLPEVAGIFEEAGMGLPGPTTALVRFGLWARKSWKVGVAIGPVLIPAIYWLYRHAGRLAPCIPVLGRALLDASWATFCMTLADCVGSGMAPAEALSTAARVGWPRVRGPAELASIAVAQGVPLALCLDGFHPAVQRVLATQSEDTARRLMDIGHLLESTSAAQVEGFILAMQPVLTTLTAILIGAVSILICLPALTTMNIP